MKSGKQVKIWLGVRLLLLMGITFILVQKTIMGIVDIMQFAEVASAALIMTLVIIYGRACWDMLYIKGADKHPVQNDFIQNSKRPAYIIQYTGIISGFFMFGFNIIVLRQIYGIIQAAILRVSLVSLFCGLCLSVAGTAVYHEYPKKLRENLLIFVSYYRMKRYRRMQINFELLKNDLRKEQENMEQVREMYQTVRHIRHDLKNQMQLIQVLLQQQQYEQAENYLRQYEQEAIQGIESRVYCDNVILNSKSHLCRQKGIAFRLLMGSELPQISDVDLCMMLGNALDNAIEGCTGEKREVYLELRQNGQFYLIQVQNTIEGAVLERNPRLKTTKKDKSAHGIGILTIREIAKKYNGSVEFSEQDGWFTCSVVMQVRTES